ncbi:MAG TPA: cyclopropane-fatty-acyl-phospholipid synthase family protein [Burkholderiales bacterium]|nr:cyclopropane-fatty-acyl-phospholipid synthase family protein [Burkholderiales bacterium]
MNSLEQVIGRDAAGRHSLPARLFLQMLAGLRHGSLRLQTPDAETLVFNGAASGPAADLALRDWGVCAELLRGGDVAFADAYIAGRWDSGDLAALLQLAAVNERALEQAIHGRWWMRALLSLRHALNANTRRGSRRNIEAHYDLGNDFFRLWLDPGMTYSAAVFAGDTHLSLEQAQQLKYERILERLGAKPGDRILEIGCGWGGFAEHAAGSRGCRVHGITLSPSQLASARERIARRGLGHLVTLELRDYRDLEGRYDHVVSIEMFEAVGERWWSTYFDRVAALLAPGGRAVVQVITIAGAHFRRYRQGSDFIQQRVFPGGMLPSPEAFARHANGAALRVENAYGFGLDYAETLRRWERSFQERAAEVRELGFDERFMRLWRFYLAYCEAGFRAGRTDVYQFELAHA